MTLPDVPERAAVPDVSVIVPVYDTVDYLGACLDSLLTQSIGTERLEVVAVDDGSTDGSGALLDEYAERYPGVVRVLHQENSGGPARPCNVGLNHARGRFVLFLGSDDYLANDALERLVTKADEWQADVVLPTMEGVGGRYVDQRLYTGDQPDVSFPDSDLRFAISNTKLFRRSLVEEHGLRYPLDLKVGSDQPFTVAAMLAARRIGVLGPPTAYFAVKRADQGNITYRSDWRTRLADLTAVVEHLAELLPPGADRDALLVRHFTWEFDKLLTRDLALCEEEDAAALVHALRGVAERFVTDGVRRGLSLARRVRWHLVVAEDLVRLREAVAVPPGRPPLVVDEHGLYFRLPGFRDGVPDEVFSLAGTKLAPWLSEIERDATLRLEGQRIVLSARTTLVDPASSGRLLLALSPLHESGVPRAALDVPGDRGTRVLAAAPVRIDAEGAVRAELDLAGFADEGGGRVGLRLRIATPERILDRPLRLGVSGAGEVRTRSVRGEVRMASSVEDRVLVEVDVKRTLAGRLRGRPGRQA